MKIVVAFLFQRGIVTTTLTNNEGNIEMRFSDKDKRLGIFSKKQVEEYLKTEGVGLEVPTNGDQLVLCKAGMGGVYVFNPVGIEHFELWLTA